MGSTPVGGSENSFSKYFDLRTLLRHLTNSAADSNACAVCYCLGYSGPFVWDTSPKLIDRKGLGESRTGTGQKY